MIYRPTDLSGDILPVLTISDMLSGAEAVARLVNDRLNLLTGDWWENPGWGCSVVQQMEERRITEADGEALSSYLTAYVRETPGVMDVLDVHASVEDFRFSWTCTVLTDSGTASVSYTVAA